jgi:hypothetical protein
MFVVLTTHTYSMLAGALTLSIMVLPTIMRTTVGIDQIRAGYFPGRQLRGSGLAGCARLFRISCLPRCRA